MIQSRPQVKALMKEKANEKDVGFLHFGHAGVNSIIEKNITGEFHKNGCSIYLWAAKENDKNILGQMLAVIAGQGFLTCTEIVDRGVKSYDDALSKIKAKPKEEKFYFYTFDQHAGTIGKYNGENGHTGLKRKAGVITFFWGEEISLK